MRIRIAQQINLIVLAVVLALGGVLGGFFAVQQSRSLERDLERRIDLVGAYVASAVELALVRGDAAAVGALLEDVAVDPEIAYLVVKGAAGDVLAARWVSGTPGAVTERSYPLRAGAPGAPQPARALFGAVAGSSGEVVGALAIGVDLSQLRATRRTLAWGTALSVLLGAVFAAALGYVLVETVLRGALGALLEGIRAIGTGDLFHRIGPRAPRAAELAEIARAFDDMSERLSTTLISKEELEATVARRTEELSDALEEGLRTQEVLAEREERLRLLLESTAEAIYGIDRDGLCTFCNASCVRQLGCRSAEELLGRKMHDAIHHSRGDGSPMPIAECRIHRTMQDGLEYHGAEETFFRADGTSFPAECWSYPVLRGSELIGAVITFVDVSERRQMESELLKMRKLESLGVLAGGIAHDFNNMLTGILGNLSLAREQAPPGELHEVLDEAEQAAKRARSLTQQLLTFSRGGAPVKKLVAVPDVVEEAGSFALRGSAVRGHFTYAPDLWAVEADPGQLGQVIQNLVINSVQAMPHGGVISIASENVELKERGPLPLAPGRYVRISVADEGVGIPPEHLQRIFDPYFTTKKSGSGLGLATVYAVVKKHGGHVTVTSVVGMGTRIEVWLPASERRAAPLASSTPRSTPAGGRVLVMDDEPVVRNAAATMLSSLGYEVLAVGDGREAVAAYEAARAAGRPIQVVLADLTVPGGMGGADTVLALRAIDPDVRVIATSGYSNDPVMSAARDHGFVAVLPKPYAVEELARVVGEAMPDDRHRAAAAGATAPFARA